MTQEELTQYAREINEGVRDIRRLTRRSDIWLMGFLLGLTVICAATYVRLRQRVEGVDERLSAMKALIVKATPPVGTNLPPPGPWGGPGTNVWRWWDPRVGEGTNWLADWETNLFQAAQGNPTNVVLRMGEWRLGGWHTNVLGPGPSLVREEYQPTYLSVTNVVVWPSTNSLSAVPGDRLIICNGSSTRPLVTFEKLGGQFHSMEFVGPYWTTNRYLWDSKEGCWK